MDGWFCVSVRIWDCSCFMLFPLAACHWDSPSFHVLRGQKMRRPTYWRTIQDSEEDR